jgi:hypothetical protein
LLTVDCGGGDSGPPPSDIVATIPWRGNENLSYVLKNGEGEVIGRGQLLVVAVGVAPSDTTNLAQLFESESNRDESSVAVDSRTLKPKESKRTIVTPDGTDTVEVSYSAEGALIKHGDKQSGLRVPEHAYDNDTSLFLWRTIDFREGYEASYVTIITNRRNSQTVRLRVLGKETVRVPAGEFQAWKLEIRTSNAKQTAWFADTPTRTLLKYDNDRNTVFELETPLR